MTPQARERCLREARQRHNMPGQLNGYVLDIDSSITSYGKHNRLLVGRGTGQEQNLVTIREDKRGFPLSTEKDRRKVLRGYQNPLNRGERLVYLSSTNGLTSIWHEYAAIGGNHASLK